MNKTERNQRIVCERRAGHTLVDIASRYGISTEAVRQIILKETDDPRYDIEGSKQWKAKVLRHLGVIPQKADLELSTRTLNALRMHHNDLRELSSTTRAYFLRKTRRVGKKTIVEIDGLMRRHGFYFTS